MKSLKKRYIEFAWHLTGHLPTGYASNRKIIRNYGWRTVLDDTLQLTDVGYAEKGNKITSLKRHYINEEAYGFAIKEWHSIVEKGKYNSTACHTYGHVKKNTKQTFCIQSMVFTLLEGEPSIDIYYRTSELYKKFVADVIFVRDVVLPDFGLEGVEVNFHFSNMTVHPMHSLALIALTPRAYERELFMLELKDPKFYKYLVKCFNQYVEYDGPYANGRNIGIAFHTVAGKYAKRIKKDFEKRLEAL